MELHPTESTAEVLPALKDSSKSFIKQLNSARLRDFKNRRKLFEYNVNKDFPLFNSRLPVSYQVYLTRQNAWFWAQSLYGFLKHQNNTVFSQPPLKTTEQAAKQYQSLKPSSEFLRLTGENIQVTDSTVYIHRPNAEDLQFSHDAADITVEDESVYKLQYTGDSITLHQANKSMFESQSIYQTKVKQEKLDTIVKSHTYFVASGGIRTLPIYTPETDEYEDLFERFDLFYKTLETTETGKIYIVSQSKDRLKSVSNTLCSENTDLQEVFDSLGFIGDPGKSMTEYDRYSFEEFVIYEYFEDNITTEEMQSFVFAPYRPAPTSENIKHMCQIGLQISDAIETLPQEDSYEKIVDTVVDYAQVEFSVSAKQVFSTPVKPLLGIEPKEKHL